MRGARLVRAAECLIDERMPVARTARDVGLSEDQLRRSFKAQWGITPAALRRVVTLITRMERWRQWTPPPYGTAGYWADRSRWAAAREELRRLLADVQPGTALHAWSQHKIRAARRPDHRRQPYRDSIAATRREEHERLQRLLEGVLRSSARAAGQSSVEHRGDEAGGMTILHGTSCATWIP